MRECFQRGIDAPHFCEQGACLVRIDDDAAVDYVGVGWRLPLHLVHGIPRQSTDLNAELKSAVKRRTLSCDCAGRRRGAIQPECKSIQHRPQSRRFGELLEGGRSRRAQAITSAKASGGEAVAAPCRLAPELKAQLNRAFRRSALSGPPAGSAAQVAVTRPSASPRRCWGEACAHFMSTKAHAC